LDRREAEKGRMTRGVANSIYAMERTGVRGSKWINRCALLCCPSPIMLASKAASPLAPAHDRRFADTMPFHGTCSLTTRTRKRGSSRGSKVSLSYRVCVCVCVWLPVPLYGP
jgi:hypothetical protein